MSRAGIEPAGSSPLTRGKLAAISQLLVGGGLIPAHAGKTDKCLNGIQSGSAHPRSRGENRSAYVTEATGLGSSPLTRGKPSWSTPSGDLFRLIPAHAGKTQRRSGVPALLKAHPRSRGENAASSSPRGRPRGSSPLTRGKRQRFRAWPARTGLIPAHAGKTRPANEPAHPYPAHPRSRGENKRQDHCLSYSSGSSPLTRGKLGHGRGADGHQRLIPAHAGKTASYAGSCCPSGAHPRSRGENVSISMRTRPDGGSSPLTRGKQGRVHACPQARRLIPAHAGKTRVSIL